VTAGRFRVCGSSLTVSDDRTTTNVNAAIKRIGRLMIFTGNVLTATGCVGLLLVLGGLIDGELFAMGISSGIRVIGSVAIAGCLSSAIGYGVVEDLEK